MSRLCPQNATSKIYIDKFFHTSSEKKTFIFQRTQELCLCNLSDSLDTNLYNAEQVYRFRAPSTVYGKAYRQVFPHVAVIS